MNRKKISRIIAVIMICSIVSLSGKKIYAYNTENNQNSVTTPVEKSKTLVPTAKQIKEKKHFKQLKGISEAAQSKSLQETDSIENDKEIKKKVNEYLNSLDTNTLILTIAQTANELAKYNASSELAIFSDAIKNKLAPKLSSLDPNDSNTGKSTILNSEEALLNYSLQSISDYDPKDVPMLKNIIDSNKFNHLTKTTAMYKLSDVDRPTTDRYLNDIITNKDKYGIEEKCSAMFILSKYFRTSNDKEKYKNLFIKNATNIFKNKNSYNFASSSNANRDSQKLVEAAVFSLGETKDKDSIRLVANNISSINDNAIVSYFVDMNFLTIHQMLEDTNSKDDIMLALSLADISKYVEFSDNLEKLKNNSDKEIAKKAANILSELDKNKDNPIRRNPKWDDYK